MGFHVNTEQFDTWLTEQQKTYEIYALKRLDDLYLHNGPADYYYKRNRDNIKIVLMGCPNDCGKVRLHDFGIMGMTEPQLDPKGIKY